uniref:Uncharacterized protein n=1 Tax=Oryzias melastigma TaxID=30732 RepID=A0A3B3BA52_ORYME
FTAKDLTSKECVLCSATPGSVPVVVPEKHTFEDCARMQHGGFLTLINGSNVGNTSVNCKITWVASWFPHANMTPIFITKPIGYENPEPLDQTCHNITMTIPFLQFLAEQSLAVADSFWMCGNNELRNTLPYGWIGLCAIVRMKVPILMIYPDKARSEIIAGFEALVPIISIIKNAEWINYVYFNQQRMINITSEALKAIGEILHETSCMAWQNRQILDWMLAEKGGVCHMFGEYCCSYIPNNTAVEGTFTTVMEKLSGLQTELAENAGQNEVWSWLGSWGKWKEVLVKAAVGAVMVLISLVLLVCCCVPITKSLCLKLLDMRVQKMTVNRMAESVLCFGSRPLGV